MIEAVFVYGTLKRGQCRARLWPAAAASVEPAWTWGTLYGRHDYPAMTGGNDRVRGELWQFSADDIAVVLERLDQIEGTNQPFQDDLYVRTTVETWSLDDQPLAAAFIYHYATDPIADGFTKLAPGPNRWVGWP